MVVGALKIFQNLVTRVRYIQQFQTPTTDKRLSIHVLKEIFTIVVPNRFQKGAPDFLQLGEGGAIRQCHQLTQVITVFHWNSSLENHLQHIKINKAFQIANATIAVAIGAENEISGLVYSDMDRQWDNVGNTD